MGAFEKTMRLLLILSFIFPLQMFAEVDINRILFLMHRNETATAIDLYQLETDGSRHDHEALEQMCLIILEQGFRHSDPEIQLMALFGAGISANDKALHMIEEAVKSPIPQIQLAGLNTLIRTQNDEIENHLKHALRSPFLIIRLEALYHLAENKNAKTASYAESLMAIVNEELLPIFPEVFVEAGDGPSTKMLRRLISHPQENVRIATVLALAKHRRDDFLPKIRMLATHHSPRQLEVCAYAFGVLKDEDSITRLDQLTDSPHPNVKLAALVALYRLGKKDAFLQIIDLAKEENLFAIAALSDYLPGKETLSLLIRSANPHVKINAVLSLLEMQDKRCLPFLPDILLKDSRDYAFVKIYTPGRTAFAWKVIPSAQQKEDEIPALHESTLNLKETVLVKAVELDEQGFLHISSLLLSSRQNELVPALMVLLENKQTEGTIDLLKRYQQKAGAPLVRQHCSLVLYKLKQEGPYEKLITDWIATNGHECLFRFKKTGDLSSRESASSYKLTPDETSKLLIESIEVLARMQSELSINILLELIKNGNPKNRYSLAGLLMRVTQ